PPATTRHDPPVRLPSGAVLPLGLITALAAAVTVARLLRTRRRPVPTPPGQPIPLDQPLPLVIREILRASRTPIDDEQQPDPDSPPPEEPAPADGRDDPPPDTTADMPAVTSAADPPRAESATGTVDLGELPAELLRTGRLDLRGPAAVSTALALVLHLLAAHHRNRHAWPARLIIPSGAVDLLDLPRPLLGALPQVTVAASTDAALDLADREALRRARLADDTSTASLDELRTALPDEMIPTVLLLAATPTPHEGRLTAPADTRGRLGIYTVTVDPTGPAADDPPLLRWQLTAAQASDLLAVLAEAADQPTAPHQPTSADLAPTTAPSPAPAAPLATAVTEAPPCPEPVPSLATAVSVSPDPPTPRAPERPAPPAEEPGDAPRRIRLVLFGRPTLHVDGTPLMTGVRTLSLEIAAYLALHPDGISGDRLASELLPDHDPTRARNQIYRAVAALRDALRTATADPALTLITGGKSGYGLDRTLVTVDVWEFNAAITAAGHATEDGARITALTHAAAVATATPLGDTAYDWAAPVVHDLEHRAVDALADFADLHADDHPDQALAHLEHALTLTPTVEDLYRHVMRLHAARQRPDAVRRTYQRLRDALDAHGLDVDPTPETQALLAHLTRAPRPTPSQTGPRRIIRPALPRRPEHPST
ncbi:hypothetical protein MXD63_26475, partial [Frankia sp. Cpl3]|nr:hypothetical protein [Frankia sp. Cpl3]